MIGDPSRPPMVSVVMATFNRLNYLPAAVDSVFAQTFDDWELIIADDGSGEETRQYLQTLRSSPRVRLLLLEHSGNPGAVRNAALREARGEWIAFLDSDDVWHPPKLETQLALMRANVRRPWSYTAVTRIDAEGRVIPGPHNRPRKLHQGDILAQVIRWEAGIALPTVMANRQLLAQVGGFDEAHAMFEDFDLWLRLASHSEASAIDTPLTSVRHHAEHYSSQGEHALRDWIALFERWKSHLDPPHLKRELESQCVRCTVRMAMDEVSRGRRAAALRILLRERSSAWHHRAWWVGVGRTLVSIAVPASLRGLLRALRAPKAA